MFSDISGLYARDARSTPSPRCDSQTCLQASPGECAQEAVLSLAESHCSGTTHQRGTERVGHSGDLAQVGEFLWLQERAGPRAGAGQEGRSHGADRETPWASEVEEELWVTPCIWWGVDGGWQALF